MPLLNIPESWKEPLRPFYLKWLYFPLGGAKPEYFQTCWQFPTLQEQPLAPAEPGKPDLLVLPMSDWHSRRQRTQHLAMGLAALGHRCLYLSPHLGREFPAVYPGSSRLSCRRLDDRIAELHIHLPREPVYHHRLLREQEEARITKALRTLLQQAGVSRPAVLVSFPVWTGVARRLKAELGCSIIYDCHDLIEGFETSRRSSWRRKTNCFA